MITKSAGLNVVAWQWAIPHVVVVRQVPAEARAKAMLSGPEVGLWGNPLVLARARRFVL